MSGAIGAERSAEDTDLDAAQEAGPGDAARAAVPDAVQETVPGDAAQETVPDGAARAGGRGLGRAWAVSAVLLVLLVAAVASGALWWSDRAAAADRDEAVSAARSAAIALTSIDFGTADQDVRRVVDAGTGEFGDLFRQNLDPYVRMVRDSQVTSRGEITATGVSRSDARSAEVVLAVRGEVRNASSPEPQQRLYRMKLDVVKEGERWLVSKLEFVG